MIAGGVLVVPALLHGVFFLQYGKMNRELTHTGTDAFECPGSGTAGTMSGTINRVKFLLCEAVQFENGSKQHEGILNSKGETLRQRGIARALSISFDRPAANTGTALVSYQRDSTFSQSIRASRQSFLPRRKGPGPEQCSHASRTTGPRRRKDIPS